MLWKALTPMLLLVAVATDAAAIPLSDLIFDGGAVTVEDLRFGAFAGGDFVGDFEAAAIDAAPWTTGGEHGLRFAGDFVETTFQKELRVGFDVDATPGRRLAGVTLVFDGILTGTGLVLGQLDLCCDVSDSVALAAPGATTAHLDFARGATGAHAFLAFAFESGPSGSARVSSIAATFATTPVPAPGPLALLAAAMAALLLPAITREIVRARRGRPDGSGLRCEPFRVHDRHGGGRWRLARRGHRPNGREAGVDGDCRVRLDEAEPTAAGALGAVTVPVSGTAAKMQNARRHAAPRLEMVDDTGLEPVTSGM